MCLAKTQLRMHFYDRDALSDQFTTVGSDRQCVCAKHEDSTAFIKVQVKLYMCTPLRYMEGWRCSSSFNLGDNPQSYMDKLDTQNLICTQEM
jgi:hypothetical protein